MILVFFAVELAVNIYVRSSSSIFNMNATIISVETPQFGEAGHAGFFRKKIYASLINLNPFF